MLLHLLSASLAMVSIGGAVALAQPAAARKPQIVLVHGAFAESSSWDGVIAGLTADGYGVTAVANPLRGLRSDSEYVAAVVKSIDGPVVLVGHSYGGSVITNAAYGQPNVKALVYIDGAAPDVGESTAALAAKFPGSTLGPTLAPPVTLRDGSKDLYIRQKDYHAQFAADVPEANAALMFATQRPITEAALGEASGKPAWKSVPSWFIYGGLDKNIPPAAHAFMAKRAGAIEMIEVEGASHVVMVSHPKQVADLIDRAAKSPLTPTASAPSADASKAEASASTDAFAPAPVVPLASEASARLVVDQPLAEQLARGYVVIRYRAENVRILPVYGPDAAAVLPRVGHLHITVDDLPWHWLDSSNEPLSVNGMLPGKHSILLELESATHHVLDSKTIHFDIPERR